LQCEFVFCYLQQGKGLAAGSSSCSYELADEVKGPGTSHCSVQECIKKSCATRLAYYGAIK